MNRSDKKKIIEKYAVHTKDFKTISFHIQRTTTLEKDYFKWWVKEEDI